MHKDTRRATKSSRSGPLVRRRTAGAVCSAFLNATRNDSGGQCSRFASSQIHRTASRALGEDARSRVVLRLSRAAYSAAVPSGLRTQFPWLISAASDRTESILTTPQRLFDEVGREEDTSTI